MSPLGGVANHQDPAGDRQHGLEGRRFGHWLIHVDLDGDLGSRHGLLRRQVIKFHILSMVYSDASPCSEADTTAATSCSGIALVWLSRTTMTPQSNGPLIPSRVRRVSRHRFKQVPPAHQIVALQHPGAAASRALLVNDFIGVQVDEHNQGVPTPQRRLQGTAARAQSFAYEPYEDS
jgi:hypothetical protein